MRRCLIAIFALHLFLSVSAFAFGSPHGAPAGQAGAGLAIQAEAALPSSGLAEGEGEGDGEGVVGADATALHALVDKLADLPDGLPRVAALLRPPVDACSRIDYRQRAALPPSLDALLRPPRSFLSAA